MKTDIWMPIYIGDYLKDTRHLNTEEHGAYFLILIELWNKQGKIEKVKLPRISLKTNEYFYEKIWPQIEEFFTENGGVIKQKRITKELKASMKRRKIAKDNGKKGGRPKTQKKPIGLKGVNPQETSSPSPSPTPSISKEVKDIYIDFPELNIEAWGKWLDYKKQIKSKYKTENGELSKIKELIKISKGDKTLQAQIIKQSIDEEWKGLFPLKKQDGDKTNGKHTGLNEIDYSKGVNKDGSF